MVTRCVLPLLLLLTGFVAFTSGCEVFDSFRSTIAGATPRERYEHTLRNAGVDRTALGNAWLKAGDDGLSNAVRVALPFREVTFINPAEPAARGFRLALKRGELLHVRVKADTGDSALVFLDLFRVPADSGASPRQVTSADDSLQIEHEVRSDADYVLRLQPELLRGGRFEVTAWTGPSLTFPVAGKTSRAVKSFFGADRDGGSRRHEGVDIFAPRGTPVVATTSGIVYRTGTNNLGGKVVFLRDEHGGQVYYYAHLDSQLVSAPLRVDGGDTLGLVGNTGNAVGTLPHLHFGIYSNGAIDPLPFIRMRNTEPPRITASTRVLGEWMRVRSGNAQLKKTPSADAGSIRSLSANTVLLVVGSNGAFHRVLLPDGIPGYISARELESTSEPIRDIQSGTGKLVRFEPRPDAAPVARLEHGTAVAELGRWDGYLLVRTSHSTRGWIARD